LPDSTSDVTSVCFCTAAAGCTLGAWAEFAMTAEVGAECAASAKTSLVPPVTPNTTIVLAAIVAAPATDRNRQLFVFIGAHLSPPVQPPLGRIDPDGNDHRIARSTGARSSREPTRRFGIASSEDA
jgi:hypothetical protein